MRTPRTHEIARACIPVSDEAVIQRAVKRNAAVAYLTQHNYGYFSVRSLPMEELTRLCKKVRKEN